MHFSLKDLQVSKHTLHTVQLCVCMHAKSNDIDICKESNNQILIERKVNVALVLTEKV